MIDAEAMFTRLGISTDQPGFYDHPAFIAEERQNPDLLEQYAHFVSTRQFEAEYLERARRVVTGASAFMHEQLERDGRFGACGDLSTVFSRMLDRFGIWNYAIKGSLTLEFPREARLPAVSFGPIVISTNPAVVGHAWLCAPPYNIVDLTIAQQPYSRNHRDYLPKMVLAEQGTKGRFDPENIFDPDAAAAFVARYGRRPGRRDVEALTPGLAARATRLGILRVDLPRAVAKYTCCGVTALDVPLEGAKNLTLAGRVPLQVFEDLSAAIQGLLGP